MLQHILANAKSVVTKTKWHTTDQKVKQNLFLFQIQERLYAEKIHKTSDRNFTLGHL